MTEPPDLREGEGPLGDLKMLRGELDDARALLERAVKLATEHGNEWYAGQARRTLGRCHLAAGDVVRALEVGGEALALAERIVQDTEKGRVDLNDLGRRARRLLEKSSRPAEGEQLF